VNSIHKKGLVINAFDTLLYAGMILIAVITLYPFVNVLAISLNQSTDTVKGGIYIFPRIFTFQNYVRVFAFNGLLNAFMISVLRTVIGTAVTISCTSMLAYTFSRRDFMARKLFSAACVITMYVSGGMIPDFMLLRSLGLMNSFLVYIMPSIVWVWSIFVIRSFIDTLPISFQESARIDGANDFVIFARIILPLCVPVLATMCLFMAVIQWNAWFDTYLYNGSNRKLSTLQFELMKILLNTDTAQQQAAINNTNSDTLSRMVSPESIRMAITIVATLPILFVYPFLQKYFVKGLTLGGIKG
jgi:putative aldouronate transport system permease protein